MSAKRQNTNVEFISKVLCVYFGSSLIIHHSISLQYSGRNMQPLFQPTTNFKVSPFELILYSKCGVCFSLVGFFFRLGRGKKRSSDGCWSLRWKTLRNGALDNKSVQPLLPNCRSTEVSNSNQKHSLFSVQGGTVVWFGRKFKELLVQDPDWHGNLSRLHLHSHKYTHFHALQPLTHVLFPPTVW